MRRKPENEIFTRSAFVNGPLCGILVMNRAKTPPMGERPKGRMDCLNRRKILLILWLLVLSIAAMIFLFSAQDGVSSTHTSDGFVYALLRFFHPDYDGLSSAAQRALYASFQFYVRKGAHFTEFALLGAALRMLTRALKARRPGPLSWCAGTLYACTDELHQMLVGTRSAMWQDVCIDSAGVLLGVAAAAAVLALRARKRKGDGSAEP